MQLTQGNRWAGLSKVMKRGCFPFFLVCHLTVSAAHGADTVLETYVDRCSTCHLPGIAGAPQVGDRAEWTKRVRAGINAVYRNAIEGIPNTAMTARGGSADLSEAVMRAIVDWMIAQAKLPPEALQAAARYDALRISNRDFIRLDTNFDGGISPGEVAHDETLSRNFARFDANRDGRLSMTEYENAESVLERERRAVRVDDRTLAATARAAISKLKGIDAANTKVEAVDGNVSMIGIVEDADAAQRAFDLVKRIPGVQRIENRLVSGEQIGWD